jgi:FAD-linked oxidoreductase
MTETWSNWSGSVLASPARLEHPRTERELAAIVRAADKVRVFGAGHSFMPLCETDGTLIQLDELEGRIELAPDAKSAWAPAGWSLRQLTRELWNLGYSLPNQGDINPQSLAGAISTGTHGTGAELGSLSTFARAFRLMLADGSIVECSREQRPDLFEAQRLSLGLLGIALSIRVDLVPCMHLEETIRVAPLQEFGALAASHRHAEFFVFPYADYAIMKTLHPVEPADSKYEPGRDEESIFRRCCDLSAALPRLTGPLQRLMMRAIKNTRRTGPAHLIFPSERTVPFEEMEYELPREVGLAVLQEAIAWVRKKRLPVTFPFEFRWVAGDDIWLSPFNSGPGASISMHQYSKMPWRELFAHAEPIFRSAGGRPHWAKRHTLTVEDVDSLYPRAAAFKAVRSEIDPHGKFTNGHLARLFPLRAQ